MFYAATLSRIPSYLFYLWMTHQGEVIQVFWASGLGAPATTVWRRAPRKRMLGC
jgi:hypothetical protein